MTDLTGSGNVVFVDQISDLVWNVTHELPGPRDVHRDSRRLEEILLLHAVLVGNKPLAIATHCIVIIFRQRLASVEENPSLMNGQCLPVIGSSASRSRHSSKRVWKPNRTWTGDSLPIYTETCSFFRFRTTVTDGHCRSRRISLGLKNTTSVCVRKSQITFYRCTNYCNNYGYLRPTISVTDICFWSAPLSANNLYCFESDWITSFITNVVKLLSYVTIFFPSFFMAWPNSSVLLIEEHKKHNVITFIKID